MISYVLESEKVHYFLPYFFHILCIIYIFVVYGATPLDIDIKRCIVPGGFTVQTAALSDNRISIRSY